MIPRNTLDDTLDKLREDIPLVGMVLSKVPREKEYGTYTEKDVFGS